MSSDQSTPRRGSDSSGWYGFFSNVVAVVVAKLLTFCDCFGSVIGMSFTNPFACGYRVVMSLMFRLESWLQVPGDLYVDSVVQTYLEWY